MGKGILLHLKANLHVHMHLLICVYLKTMMQDLPFDPTGELDGLRQFIEDNVDLCKWIGIIVISTQVELMELIIYPLARF